MPTWRRFLLKREQWSRLWEALRVMSAPASLGIVAGLLTGLTGPDSAVVAALLPAVITGVGGALLAFKLRREGNTWAPDFLAACGAVTFFSLFLVIGMFVGFAVDEHAEERTRELQRQRYAEDLDFRGRSLQRCSEIQELVNAHRARAILAPLPSEAFCDIGPVDAR